MISDEDDQPPSPPRPKRPNPDEQIRELTPELIARQQAAMEAWQSAPGIRRHCISMLVEPFIGRFVLPKSKPED